VSFLSFCGVSITNALIFELTKEEFDRNKVIMMTMRMRVLYFVCTKPMPGGLFLDN